MNKLIALKDLKKSLNESADAKIDRNSGNDVVVGLRNDDLSDDCFDAFEDWGTGTKNAFTVFLNKSGLVFATAKCLTDENETDDDYRLVIGKSIIKNHKKSLGDLTKEVSDLMSGLRKAFLEAYPEGSVNKEAPKIELFWVN